MATGVPKARRRLAPNGGFGSDGAPEVRLEYAGKKPPAAAIANPASINALVWGSADPGGSRLYFGENMGVLSNLRDDRAICGNVKLIYIDPPFATSTAFHSRNLDHAYEDVLVGSDYIGFLRDRLVLLHHLLAMDGSLYLHLDAKMVFYMKIILDEIFGRDGFRNLITRKKCNPKNYTRKQYGNVADYILFYTKSARYTWNRPAEKWTAERAKEYQYVDANSGRLFMKVPVHAPGVRRGETGGLWRGKAPPPGKHWQFPPRVLDQMDARGEIYWSPNGNPRRKIFLDQSSGVNVQDIWMDFRDAHNQNVRITGYPTEKNPDLIRRIIEASSDPGDVVLDCFSGSGTTLAVAERLGRQWIGVDNSTEALRATLKRFAQGTEPMGDFVNTAGREINPQRELWEEGICSLAEAAHAPIVDFGFWAEEALLNQAREMVQEWLQLLSTSEPNGISTPDPIQGALGGATPRRNPPKRPEAKRVHGGAAALADETKHDRPEKSQEIRDLELPECSVRHVSAIFQRLIE